MSTAVLPQTGGRRVTSTDRGGQLGQRAGHERPDDREGDLDDIGSGSSLRVGRAVARGAVIAPSAQMDDGEGRADHHRAPQRGIVQPAVAPGVGEKPQDEREIRGRRSRRPAYRTAPPRCVRHASSGPRQPCQARSTARNRPLGRPPPRARPGPPAGRASRSSDPRAASAGRRTAPHALRNSATISSAMWADARTIKRIAIHVTCNSIRPSASLLQWSQDNTSQAPGV